MNDELPQEPSPEPVVEQVPVATAPPVPDSTPEQGQMMTNATCWLQPNPRYGDGEPLVEIPQGSVVDLGADVQRDDYQRPWQQVTFEGQTGYVQRQNLRDA